MSYLNNPKYKSNKQLKEIEALLEKLYPLLSNFWGSCPDEIVNITDYKRYDHIGRLLHRIRLEVVPEDFIDFPILREEDKEKAGTVEDVYDYE